MAEVSIIVPVYQVEKYIGKCIESILAQTFIDFELILVDDGSQDLSGKICDEYASTDNRIKVFHRKNRGVAAARNYGITCADGEYICFADADDWMEPAVIEQCLSKIKENDADVLRHGHTMELWKNEKCVNKEEKNAPDFAKVLTHEQAADRMEEFWQNCSNYVWNYFFKKEAIGELRFPEITISEDHIFVLGVLKNCRRICFLSGNGYHYCMRMGSSANRWQETGIECQVKMLQSCQDFFEGFGIKGERKKKLMADMAVNAYSYAIYLMCFPECRWSVSEKAAKSREVRKALDIDSYVPYVRHTGLAAGDRVKRQLICKKQEKWMLILGPVFMKVVRRVKG